MKKIVIMLLILVFVALLAVLVKTYVDIKRAKEYVEFVTDSANESLVKVEQINQLLNEMQYDEQEEDVSEYREKLDEIKSIYTNTNSRRDELKVPYDSQAVEENFDEYQNDFNNVINSYEALIISVEDLEDTEVFEDKLEDYIESSNELQLDSEGLEMDLNEFVQNYTKFDFYTILNAIKSI
jgi:uncharacterized protein YxeA